jgi:hypothetical protein
MLRERAGELAERDQPKRPSLCPTPFYASGANAISSGMTTAEDIEKAVEQLAPQELARFRAWFEAFDAQQFDTAIERDARAGKLDAHADEALAAHRAGRSREL